MPKINREEYGILKELDDKWKWIARDEDSKESTFPNELWLYEYKPRRTQIHWLGEGGSTLRLGYVNLFQFIQWEDEEPYNIAELIEEYEKYQYTADYWAEAAKKVMEVWRDAGKAVHKAFYNEEETEVKKDKKWFVDKWTKERNKTDVRDTMYHFINEFIADVNQLDEPEVLSQEFIDEKAVEVYADTEDAEVHAVFRMRDLQNLLVPKQEKLESKIKTLIEKYEQEDGQYSNPENSWIGGFIEDLENLVEEEQKYYARIKGWENVTTGSEAFNWVYFKEKDTVGISKAVENKYQAVSFTKYEWSNLGINEYNADFVLVEELEE